MNAKTLDCTDFIKCIPGNLFKPDTGPMAINRNISTY